ncbi:hypothetical protein N7481_012991 [Penicillium waksmanii]|uniref:uncharacterized protein n=1 Tax=Penicillium waksmanii TaxID=69791 RepID=UPI002548EF09|nr:uncharacterized protein N7481_012991 [Penicillium waksmanii]KAJ5966277.1 hypothetical protein N7481_012991 [Penicillium waksmanii]
MHLFILGATGRTGLYGYKYALEQGFTVTILVRKADGIEPQEGLTVVEGSPLSGEDMARAFKESGTPVDAILVFLNAPRAGQNPWGKFLGPPRLIADSTRNAARALIHAQQNSLAASGGSKPRLVVMNALGVGESYAVTPYIVRFMIAFSNVSESYKDHNAVNDEIEEVCGEDVVWTLPLPVGLKGGGLCPVKTFGSTESGASLFITRESCARWMVDVAAGREGDQFDNKRVIVSN